MEKKNILEKDVHAFLGTASISGFVEKPVE